MSVVRGADNSFYVKFIATYAPTFCGYIISVLAIVNKDWKKILRKIQSGN